LQQKKKINKKLGEILVSNKVISEENLSKALDFQRTEGGLLGDILVKLGYVNERDIVRALTVQYGFPYLPLEKYDLKKELRKVIPENVARQYGIVPLDDFGTVLTVAMSNPLNSRAVEDIEMMSGMKVQVFISTIKSIREAIERLYSEE
jgi:type IV pilus assembly protein PilB